MTSTASFWGRATGSSSGRCSGYGSACRIVYVVDEPGAFGFAYGTLPAHPEQGEEAFVVRRDAGGAVTFAITAFSRPRHPLARIGGPVSRQVQVATTRRYLRALKAFAAGR